MDAEAIRRASLLVADDANAARVEAGDLLLAEAEGKLEWGSVRSLKDVVTGTIRRGAPEQISLFKSVGLALEDLALAAVVLERAQLSRAGEPLNL